jgi:hypothetical protein
MHPLNQNKLCRLYLHKYNMLNISHMKLCSKLLHNFFNYLRSQYVTFKIYTKDSKYQIYTSNWSQFVTGLSFCMLWKIHIV